MKLDTVKNMDIGRYSGIWFEIARKPFFQEDGMTNITATYNITDNKTIEVINQGIKNGKLKKATGKAWIPDLENPGHLKVRFFWPFKSDYKIILLDTIDYSYSVVASSGAKYLWILSRNKKMEESIYNQLLTDIESMGISIDDITITKQE